MTDPQDRAAALEALADRIEVGEPNLTNTLLIEIGALPAAANFKPLYDLQAAADLCAKVLPEAAHGYDAGGREPTVAFVARPHEEGNAYKVATFVVMPPGSNPAAALTAAVCRAKAVELREGKSP